MIFGRALDTVMDRAVVPGYTSLGYRLRRSLAGTDQPLPRMEGKTVLVTGATSGLGEAAAEGFAELGARVHLLVRDAERGGRLRDRITAQTSGAEVRVERCDLASLRQVRRFATRFSSERDRLDVLVNNAGILNVERELSEDGNELALAINVLAPFLLTNLLSGLLADSAPSRVITVSSGGMYTRRVDVDDLQAEHGDYDGTGVYAKTKRAQVILTELWAERTAGSQIDFHAMHPGWADTPGVQSSLPGFHKLVGPLLRDPAQGADTIVWLGAADEPAERPGAFWHDRRPRPTHRVPWTRETTDERRRLWRACTRLTGWDGDLPGAAQTS